MTDYFHLDPTWKTELIHYFNGHNLIKRIDEQILKTKTQEGIDGGPWRQNWADASIPCALEGRAPTQPVPTTLKSASHSQLGLIYPRKHDDSRLFGEKLKPGIRVKVVLTGTAGKYREEYVSSSSVSPWCLPLHR